jgi:hypothetical protein
LGRLALAAGDTATAGRYLTASVEGFRDGDYLTELATTVADLSNYALASGDLDAAERYVAEAITIAAPRELVAAQCSALATRARIRATQATTQDNFDLLLQGRDAADAALRLAARRQLAWHELDALRAHVALDHVGHTGHSWATRADALYARLVPQGLHPDPLAKVEQHASVQQGGDRAHGSQAQPHVRTDGSDAAPEEPADMASSTHLANQGRPILDEGAAPSAPRPGERTTPTEPDSRPTT